MDVKGTIRVLLRRKPGHNDAAEPLKPPPLLVTVWHRVALKYDICRITKSDLQAAAQELYASGAIGLPDLRLLSLHPDTHAPNWPDWSKFETPAEQGGRRDWVFEVEARLAAGHPDPLYISYQTQLLGLFKRFQNARAEMQPPALQAVPAREQSWSGSPNLARLTQVPVVARGVPALTA